MTPLAALFGAFLDQLGKQSCALRLPTAVTFLKAILLTSSIGCSHGIDSSSVCAPIIPPLELVLQIRAKVNGEMRGTAPDHSINSCLEVGATLFGLSSYKLGVAIHILATPSAEKEGSAAKVNATFCTVMSGSRVSTTEIDRVEASKQAGGRLDFTESHRGGQKWRGWWAGDLSTGPGGGSTR